MKSYEIKRFHGSFDEIPFLEIEEKYLETPENVSARGQIAYDDEGFIVKLQTKEYQHRAVEKGPLGSPCEDCCLEFFFCPMESDGRYFNIEFNSNACMYLGFATSIKDLKRIVFEDENLFSPKVTFTDGGWEIEYKVPFSFIRQFFPEFEVHEGKRIRANCFKCAETTEPPHYLSWSRVSEENFTYHRSEYFGLMTIVN